MKIHFKITIQKKFNLNEPLLYLSDSIVYEWFLPEHWSFVFVVLRLWGEHGDSFLILWRGVFWRWLALFVAFYLVIWGWRHIGCWGRGVVATYGWRVGCSHHLAFHHHVLPEGEDHDPTEEVDGGEHAQDGEGGDVLTIVQTQLGCAKQYRNYNANLRNIISDFYILNEYWPWLSWERRH